MITELRAGVLLFVSLAFFMIIITFFAISMVMRPNRWSERTRLHGGARSSANAGLCLLHDAGYHVAWAPQFGAGHPPLRSRHAMISTRAFVF
jgi:hypothetical protein